MDSSPGGRALEPSLPAITSLTASPTPGDKKPAPSLLPAFEPLSSSPALPRPAKRLARSGSVASARLKYPTPVPTSSTGILSSPSRNPHGHPARIPPLPTHSVASERVPLGALPTVELPENGETVTMGRSGTSSDYQLSNNRLISRVHVRTRFVPTSTGAGENPLSVLPARIEVVCTGWNGLKVHCQGRTCELGKGDVFESKAENEDVMLDVQDARVLLRWPRRDRDRDRDSIANLSDSSWDESPRPARNSASGLLQASPLRRSTRMESPESPTPAGVLSARSGNALQILMPEGGGDQDDEPVVHIYEDASADEQELPQHTAQQAGASFATVAASSFSSELSDPVSDGENDPDEENDPIIHSFGPFGANLNNRLASFTTNSPKVPVRVPGSGSGSSPRQAGSGMSAAARALSAAAQAREALKPKSATPVQESPRAPSPTVKEEEVDLSGVDIPTISNHVINQLAFSRLSSTPLTTILSNLPAEERKGLDKAMLRRIIETTACVGVIERQGKDAAGKPLESEYYYVPENDDDEHRRAAVVNDLRKPSLRNCRKHHVQYYWKRPRTP